MTGPDRREAQQELIDAEMRASRRLVIDAFRPRLREDPGAVAAGEFLALADWTIVRTAVVIAAGAVADGCALYVRNPRTGTLRLSRYRGLPHPLLQSFSTAGPVGDVLVTADLTAGPLFGAGFRVVQRYPLRGEAEGDGEPLLGVLSLFFRGAGPYPRQRRLARAAADAIARVHPPPAEVVQP